MTANPDTHSKTIGYLLWIFGFMGAHRFYYGRQLTGTLWFLTLGLFFVGWIIDLFLIPGTDRDADRRYVAGRTRATTSAGCCSPSWESSASTASISASGSPDCFGC